MSYGRARASTSSSNRHHPRLSLADGSEIDMSVEDRDEKHFAPVRRSKYVSKRARHDSDDDDDFVGRDVSSFASTGSSAGPKFVHPKPREIGEYSGIGEVHGAPGDERIIPVKEGQLVGKHRTDPVPYQGSVTNPCRVLRPEVVFEERSQNFNLSKGGTVKLVAPLGCLEDFVEPIGAVLFSRVGDEPTGYRNSDPYGAYVKTSGCVNGLLTTDDIKVQGCKLFDQDPNPDTRYNHDDVGTLQHGGTITVQHTGPYPIGVEDRVYVSKFPTTTVDSNGNVVSKVWVPGTSKSRFWPSLFPWRYSSNESYFAATRSQINSIWDDHHPEGITSTAEAQSALEAVQNAVNIQLFSEASEDLPARDYANAYIAARLWDLHDGEEANVARNIGEAVLKWTQKLYQKKATSSAMYHANLGAGGISFSHPSLNHSIAAELLKESTWTENNRSITKMRPGAALSRWLNDAKEGFCQQQDGFMLSHYLGRSQHTSETSGSFDVFLGRD